MSLNRLITRAVATAKRVTGSLLVNVAHLPATGGTDGYQATLGAAVTRPALWEDASKAIRMGDGIEKLAIGKLTFLEPVQVTSHDRFRLPTMGANESAPVLKRGALMDPSAKPYLTEVWLGSEPVRRS